MSALEIQRDSLVRRIYDINEKDFEGVAMELWKYQYTFNPLYRSYCDLLGIQRDQVSKMAEIPYLPIVMFREHEIKTGNWTHEKVFRSSGTRGSIQSKHFVRDVNWYHGISERCFRGSFESEADYAWIGLLPSYLERADSSLVDMVHHFMERSQHADNRFFPQIDQVLIASLASLKHSNYPTILIGVSFALIDLFERTDVPVWDNLLVIETGGMKGRGKEMTREELYMQLRQHYEGLRIASEYGMTELLSQAYMTGDYFWCGPTMHVRMRDISDPLRLIEHGQRGVINIIDLANIDTCAFIATDDVGISYVDGSFEVLGRLDNSDLRGCNLLYA
ncbi:MAG: acyl transferase [Saprospiraceae bacterium]|nr:acyl transferase [Saprospiraceae bacterium]